ncbi:hypothetical protein F2P56_029951 [Juglans regia]|uniref:Uncharacterized protein LOC109014400 isoform X1 n=2 Tax=Juglans regia TaxID=51240 RepID=A0A2I4H8E5_JUGRE|nr:uncharacterized protein LOC109014400 isoform X1 [Juglans regia]XP_035540359.1 uncharacterized protein LOC109014400 isoform X1 [Juglans regia]KAF5449515.1 hypothetical protein F2P56_029951 [Juglans regia]
MDLEHGCLSSTHLGTHPEITEGNGISKHSETRPEVLEGCGGSEHFEINPFLIDGSQSITDAETHSIEIDRTGSSRHSETQANVIDGSDSCQEDPSNEGDPHALAKRLGPSYSSTSSSSHSSLEFLFQGDSVVASKSGQSTPSFPSPEKDTQLAFQDESEVSSNIFSKSDERDNDGPDPLSTSQVPEINHESMVHGTSPTQSPQVQVMNRSGGYDPNRIPSSVFARSKSTTPMEWSVASNESLFSLHIGNASFSKDHVFLFGDLKPEELIKSDELFALSPTSPLPELGTDKKNIKIAHDSEATVVADEIVKDSERVSVEAQSEEKMSPPVVSWNSSSLSHRSDESVASFAFPIKKKCAWTLCYCSNCSWAFHYCTWPSCYCSNCSWAFCYCWNCSRKRLCCHSSTILAGGERSGRLKTDGGKRLQEPPAPKVTSNSTSKCCFPCLFWRPWCFRSHCC